MDQGSLIVNYTGHGGEFAWSNSRILENSDIGNMLNTDRLPAVITATCEFGRFDNPDLRSGAELMLLEPEVGAIAMFTTVRLVFSGPNATLNRNFYNYALTYDPDKNRMPTIGEIMMHTKNETFKSGSFTNLNSRNFTLLGDPGLILSYPQLQAKITHVNGQIVRVLEEEFYAVGNVYKGAAWNGQNEQGRLMSSGVYVYQVLLEDMESGQRVEAGRRMVLLRP